MPRRIIIAAAAQISAQTPLSDEWMDAPRPLDTPMAAAVDPDFRAYLTAGEARRMGRSLRRCVAVSMAALQAGGVAVPDAIVVGTGLGSVESTEAFLQDLCAHGEQLLKPTHFIQSVHNTYASTVGILTRAHGYNATYSHRGISFESALADAVRGLRSGLLDNALVGGHDGITASYYAMLHGIGYLGRHGMVAAAPSHSAFLLRAEDVSDTADTISSVDGLCELSGVRLLYRPTDDEVREAVATLAADANIVRSDIGTVMTGANGDAEGDAWYAAAFPDIPQTGYKHIFGESYTACGLGLYAAAHILHRAAVPSHYLLVAHRYEAGRHVSLILLRASCGR